MSTQNAVLMLVFNRPDVTEKVFQAVRAARPPRLYIAADGPRLNRPDDEVKTAEVRNIFAQIDWPCDVKTRYLAENLGCRLAVSSAIDWFFGLEEQGIVLEDDVLPTPGFFSYCDLMLERYKSDERVYSIVGNNLVEPWFKSEDSYFFSKVFFVWGWASWRRAWTHYDVNMASWPAIKEGTLSLPFMPSNSLHRAYWRLVFDLAYKNQISTWDHQWTYAHWKNEALSVTPSGNLVRNIGFGADATHTSGSDPEYIRRLRLIEEFNPLQEPSIVEDNSHHYQYMANHVLGISILTWVRLSLRRFPMFFHWLKKMSNKLRAT